VGAAKESVASLTGPAAAETMRLLISQWRDLDRTIAAGQGIVATLVESDAIQREQARLMATIPGIGAWTAQVLSLELGDMARFRDHRALVAWCGLDPHEDRSGDGVIKRGISHRGNAHVRRALFMPACTAAKHLHAVGELDRRLRTTGRAPLVAIVACMHKLLRIAFAVVRSGKPFSTEHEAQRRAQADAVHAARCTTQADIAHTILVDLTAPLSAAEARRRRRIRNAAARALPPCEVEPQGDAGEQAATAVCKAPADKEAGTSVGKRPGAERSPGRQQPAGADPGSQKSTSPEAKPEAANSVR
jgi:hypothetical protein